MDHMRLRDVKLDDLHFMIKARRRDISIIEHDAPSRQDRREADDSEEMRRSDLLILPMTKTQLDVGASASYTDTRRRICKWVGHDREGFPQWLKDEILAHGLCSTSEARNHQWFCYILSADWRYDERHNLGPN